MRTSWWAWPALAGIAIGLALLARAALGMLAGMPEASRANIAAVLKRRARVISVAGVVLAWTLVYALYSMTLPANIQQAEAAPGGTSALPSPIATDEVEAGGGLHGRPGVNSPVPSAAGSGGQSEGELPDTPSLPPVGGGPKQEPCSVQEQSDQVRMLQAAVEELTGEKVGADVALLIDAVAGCSDPASAALALLGPVNAIIQRIGILPDTIDLPDTQPIVVPTVPEPIAAPLRPYVFEACAEATRQLTTVGALSIFLHLDYNDLVAVFSNVDAVCSAFAPA